MTPVLLLATLPTSADIPDTVARAAAAFARGVESRDDAAKARPVFADAAAGFDRAREKGNRTANLALARAAAHRLAGNLPAAVAALLDGLESHPADRRLQLALEDARGAVEYPADGALAGLCRPPPPGGVRSRVAGWEAVLAAAGLWFGACAAGARFAMTRRAAWLVAAGAGVAALAGFGWRWQGGAGDPRPAVVVRAPAVLRVGNADAFPPRVEPALPAGAEGRELSRRGGWVQVELAGGAAGWLPERAVTEVAGRK